MPSWCYPHQHRWGATKGPGGAAPSAQRAADKRADGLDSAEDGALQEDGKLGPSGDSTDLFSVWRSSLSSSAL